MKKMGKMLTKLLCVLLCITMIVTGLPMMSETAQAATVQQRKFIKIQQEVFVPSLGEKAQITFNLEATRKINVYVQDGKRKIAHLVTAKEYKGGYVTHKLQWDGKDDDGNYVKSGTYKVIVEPQGKYMKYRSVAEVCVVADTRQSIYIAPNRRGSVYKIYGKGGTQQGIDKVSIAVKKDGRVVDTISAALDENLWHAKLSMSAYSLYELTAEIQSGGEIVRHSISAVKHTFRITDRLEYLAAAYYGDYTWDPIIKRDNGLYDTYTNSGELVGTNLLIINPKRAVKQELTDNNNVVNQHLGVIDQLKRTAAMHYPALSMGNNFYVHTDLYIDGYTPLELVRGYNSMSESFHEFGMNWTHSYTCFLQNLGNTVVIRFGDGHVENYIKTATGGYESPKGLARKLESSTDGTYILTVDGMTLYKFAVDGRILKSSDSNGNETIFTYAAGLLSKVANDSGYFKFTYNKDGTIRSVKDSGGREITYTYANGLLTGFTDAAGNVTAYHYDAYNRMDRIVSPQQVVLCKVVYDDADRVVEKTVQGSTYTYDYNDEQRSIVCTEPNGNKITFCYTKDYRIASEEDADGIVTYSYDSDTTQPKVTEKAKTVRTKRTLRAMDTAVQAQTEKTTPCALKLKTLNMNVCMGEQKNNTLYPQFCILNEGTEAVQLSDITLRYYYTVDGELPQNFWCDWSSIGAQHVTGKFVKLATPVTGADYYLEVGFQRDAGTLAPGETVDLHTRIGKEGWADFTPGDDYSQNTSAVIDYFDKVDMFYKGSLVWGRGSASGEGNDTPSLDGDGENTGSSTESKPEHTENDINQEEIIVPKGVNNLKLKMYNTGNEGTFANTIHPMICLVNQGENMVKLSDVKIRYYYTKDDDKPQNFWCDWSETGTGAVTGTFHTLEQPMDGADTYIEIGFTQEAGYLDIGASLHIHARIAKKDWGNYDLTNDHSIRPGTDYEDWKQVDVFVNGIKVWGEDLQPQETGELETEHFDYADSTCVPVSVKMYNQNRESRSNQVSPRFQVYNVQDKPIRLSQLHLNYFYTADGPEQQIFEVDWAGIGKQFRASLRNSDVRCTFSAVNEDNTQTNCIADISFARDDLYLNPGEYLELRVRIHRPDWTKYVQSNDYSINAEGRDYEEWNKIAVFLDGRWVYGSIPLSCAQQLEPYPDEEEDVEYPSQSGESYGASTDREGNTTRCTYDKNGNVLTETDASGNTQTYTYNKRNQVTSVTDALGARTEYDYDKKGNLTSVTDAMGRKTILAYDEKGCLMSQTRPDGSIETRTYDEKGNLITITDGCGGTVKYTYDKLNRVLSHTDANGGMTSYTYSLTDQITGITDALGYVTKTYYNKDGQVKKEIDADGGVTQYVYDRETGRLIQVTNALSGKETYTYDEMGFLSKETGVNGGSISYTYDLSGRLTSRMDANGGVTSYAYDKNGNITCETDAFGNVTSYDYDRDGRLMSQTEENGAETGFTYDRLGRVIRETDALGNVVCYDYDKTGLLIKETDARGNVTAYAYDACGRVKSVTDAVGSRIVYAYDAEGRKTKETDALGNSRRWQYDKNGNVCKETDANGHSMVYAYDGNNRTSAVTDADGARLRYQYDGCGNVLSETDAMGHKTSYTYDAAGNRTSVTNATGKVYRYTYDASGQLVKETDARGYSTSYVYDKNGNLCKKTDALGGVSRTVYDLADRVIEEKDACGNRKTYQYDAAGNIVSETNANGAQTHYSYDKNNRLIQMTDALGGVMEYGHDASGNLTSVSRSGKNGQGSRTTVYTYDAAGRRTGETDPAGKSISYTYDQAGRLTGEQKKDGTKTSYRYDKAGNRTKIIYSDSRSVSYSYTKTNQISTRTDWDGTTAYSYDVLNQVTEVTDARGKKTGYTWTALGQIKGMEYPSGDTVSYRYDENGNLTKVTDTAGGVSIYTYDALDRPASRRLPCGAESAYVYDAAGRLTARTETGNAGNRTYRYTYDRNGNRTEEIQSGTGADGTIRYTYDALDELTGITDWHGERTYTYDVFHNRIEKRETGKETIRYEYNVMDQLVRAVQGQDITEYAYDGQGNRKSKTKNGAVKQLYAYDSAGRLSKVFGTEDGELDTVTAYSYDGDGNRIGKSVRKGGRLTENAHYVLDTQSSYCNIIASEDSVTGASEVYTFGDGLIGVETAKKTGYYRLDEQKTVTEKLDAAGNVTAALEYDEFGVPGQETAQTLHAASGSLAFAYTGYIYEAGTGLYDAKARAYDAATGRFLSEDRYTGGLTDTVNQNKYIYAKNNPNVYTDPDGNIVLEASAVVTLLFVAAVATSVVIVTAGYLRTRDGQMLLDNAWRVKYQGRSYTVQGFKRAFKIVGEAISDTIKKVERKCSDIITYFKNLMKPGKDKPEKKDDKPKGKAPKKNAEKGDSGAVKKPTSQGQMQNQVKRGQAPKGVRRVDPADSQIPNSQPHIHFGNDEAALNQDGTWHDARKPHPNITNKIADWIIKNGWKLPSNKKE